MQESNETFTKLGMLTGAALTLRMLFSAAKNPQIYPLVVLGSIVYIGGGYLTGKILDKSYMAAKNMYAMFSSSPATPRKSESPESSPGMLRATR